MEENQQNEMQQANQNKKRKFLFVLGPLVLLIALVGITYAFFNYTRTGGANNIKVGRISFVSENEETISLNNLFPIDPEETGIMNDSTKVGTYSIDITGDTDYSGGIEYLISTTNTNIYTSTGKTIPITLDFTVDDLGTESSNYFTARDNTNESIYKRLVGDTLVGDQMLLVGYIVPNTTSGQADGVDGNITIKAYLDENNILTSDTYDGTESDNMGTPNSIAEGKTVFTTQEWNSLQANGISFKVKVEANEGIWVNGSLEEIMRKQNYSETLNRGIMDNESSEFVSSQSGIDFGDVSSDTNGKGIYMRAGTENTSNPILYYRGDINDNNVVFANKCWKAVRTTDTGGVKLLYNGAYDNVLEVGDLVIRDEYIDVTTDSSHPFTFDNNTKVWSSTVQAQPTSIEFKFSVAGDYKLNYNDPGNYYLGYYRIKKNGNVLTTAIGEHSINLIGVLTTDVYTIEYKPDKPNSAFTTTFSVNKLTDNGMGCGDGGSDVMYSQSKYSNSLNVNSLSLLSGYMYGQINYQYESVTLSASYKFGTGFTYNDGLYTLTGMGNDPYDGRMYMCKTTNGVCNVEDSGKIFYVITSFFALDSDDVIRVSVIELENGQGIEDAINNMKKNETNSMAKTQVDSWYSSNMIAYTNRLEDTIWCNDRTLSSPIYSSNASLMLRFGPSVRINNNSPSFECADFNDRFTVASGKGNGKLTYPTALITADEVMFAGGKSNSASTFYLSVDSTYWTMSPSDLSSSNNFVNYIDSNLISGAGYIGIKGIRPAISIKPGQLIKSGTGTIYNPYVIE